MVDPGSNAEFVVGKDNVTFTNDEDNATIVGNLSNVSRIQIQQDGPTKFRVSTEKQHPLTTTERERALEIVRNNETVQQLDVMDSYTITVAPVSKVTTGHFTNIESTNSTDGMTFTAQVDAEINETEDGAVIRRNVQDDYVDDRAVIFADHPETDELKYSIKVDLANNSVISVVDQEALRRNSPLTNSTDNSSQS